MSACFNRLRDPFARSLSLGVLVCSFGTPTLAVTDLLTNPGFEDTDAVPDGVFGDGWGAFGAAGFNSFFGPNGHASLFGDRAANTGGVFQQGIAGAAGATYQFDLLNTRVESAWDADLKFGLEFYLADDATKIGEALVTADTATRLALPNVDGGGAVNGAVFSMQGTAPVGTAIVRPVILFDNVNPSYPGETGPGQPQANAFVFDSFLSEVPAPGGNLLKNPGLEDLNNDTNLGDNWGSFGNAGFNDFFGGNGHASFFGDSFDNAGGIFQQSILGTPGTEYTFSLDDVRIESAWDADVFFGLEYFGGDDFNKLGETIVQIDTNTGQVDGNAFSMTGTAVAGTEFIRPLVRFDNVNFNYLGGVPQSSLFIFDTSLSEAAALLAGDYNDDGSVDQGDLDLVLLNWGDDASQTGVPAGWINMQPTGLIGQTELDGVLLNWGNTAEAGASAVPEPASLMAVLAAGGLMMRRRA